MTAAACFDNITDLRDCFLANDLMPSFTAAMNMLGYDGDFAQDYNSPVTETAIANVRAELIRIGGLRDKGS